MVFYDFNVKALDGTSVSMGDYKGKIVLVVNTATECVFTPHYEVIQSLYDKFKE